MVAEEMIADVEASRPGRGKVVTRISEADASGRRSPRLGLFGFPHWVRHPSLGPACELRSPRDRR